VKAVPRGDEFAHGKDVGTLFEDDRIGRVLKLVDLNIGPFTGVYIAIGRL
jgi:hypothetical protein